MKNLKFLFVGVALLSLNSCMDEDKILAIPPSGALITITPDGAAVFDLNDVTGSIYSGELNDATLNVANYELNANVYYKSSNTQSGSVAVFSASTFPSRLEISAADALMAMGLSKDDVTPGDLVEFRAVITTEDGRVFTHNDLNGDSKGEALIGAYQWDVPFFCPFIDADATGSWSATLTWPSYFDESYHQGFPKTVTASSSGGVVVFNDMFGAGKDLTVTLDLDKSQSVSATTGSLEPAMAYFSGYTNPYLTQRSNTYFFSCTGSFEIALKQCVDQGCFGSGSDSVLTLTKN
tara:strand:- start:330 stop:1208 length:879 start_codon:yes stop_codon:yes gene_type:complete